MFTLHLSGNLSGKLCAAFLTCVAAPASTFTTLYSFAGLPNDGRDPSALVIGNGGVLYGICLDGGSSNQGAVFSLTPPASVGGAWTEDLYSFPGGKGGVEPTGLSISSRQVLYGTTSYGGSAKFGTVFSLRPPSAPGGSWTERVLYNFAGVRDGGNPGAGVVSSRGVIYGTTFAGGSDGEGTVFSLTPPATTGGSWTEAVIHNYSVPDGDSPLGGVVAGNDGVLYGTAQAGGLGGRGTLFSLTPPTSPGGSWTETILHAFSGTGSDGATPTGNLAIGQGSVLYGVAGGGGLNYGLVYSLSPPASPGGSWTYTIIHAFNGTDGGLPQAGVVIGGSGKLYGTTLGGGTSGDGVVFELTPPGSLVGSWTYRTLQRFSGSDGASPRAALVLGGAGVLYGTTSGGGATNNGTVFSLAP